MRRIMGALVFCLVVNYAPPVARLPVLDYFALGDSVASGWGLNADHTLCKRSLQAYPYKVAQQLSAYYEHVNLTLLACSGTSVLPRRGLSNTDQLFATQVENVLAHLSDRPTLVSITVGMNDLGWSQWLPLTGYIVSSQQDFERSIDGLTDNIARTVRADLASLFAHPNVIVVITNYHNPFNVQSIYFNVGPVPCKLLHGTEGCYERVSYALHSLNTALETTVGSLMQPSDRLAVISLYEVFKGHESPYPACGSAGVDVSQTWIQYLGDPASNGSVAYWVQPFIGNQHGDCFHPNETGASKYADAVSSAALRLLPHGSPVPLQ
jgi:lysophospholipase L1-like esterase